MAPTASILQSGPKAVSLMPSSRPAALGGACAYVHLRFWQSLRGVQWVWLFLPVSTSRTEWMRLPWDTYPTFLSKQHCLRKSQASGSMFVCREAHEGDENGTQCLISHMIFSRVLWKHLPDAGNTGPKHVYTSSTHQVCWVRGFGGFPSYMLQNGIFFFKNPLCTVILHESMPWPHLGANKWPCPISFTVVS